MRLAFLGNDPWSVPSLEALARSSHRVDLVVTRDPRPAGRGGRPRPTPVAEAARAMSLAVLETATVKRGEGFEALAASRPDVLVVVAYGEILPAAVLDVPTLAPVNLHFSILPALRGADPVRRAILEGYVTTGVTTIRMDEGMDTGPVLLQELEAVGEDDDGGSLGARLAGIGAALLVRTLDGLEAGRLEERPQDDAQATTAPKIRQDEAWIDWSRDAEDVIRLVRALAPEPGARTRFRGGLLKVLRARAVDREGRPGAIGSADGEVVVAAGRGAVTLEEVVPEGRRRMPGADWARGQRLEPGEAVGGER